MNYWPTIEGYQNLVFNKSFWMNILLIRKRCFKNVDKFILFKILEYALELYQYIKEGNIIQLYKVKNGLWKEWKDKMIVEKVDNDKKQLNLLKYGKSNQKCIIKWYYKMGYIRGAIIEKNKVDIKIIGHMSPEEIEKEIGEIYSSDEEGHPILCVFLIDHFAYIIQYANYKNLIMLV